MAKEDGNSAINSILIVIAVVGSMVAPHLGAAAKPADGRGRVHALPETREPEGLLTVALPLGATREPRDPYAVFHRSFEALLARTTGQFPPNAAVSAPPTTILPLVVSVPDPRQSHMALYYDQALVALRQAAETEGFLADRFDLKWQFEGHDDSSQNGKRAEASENFEPGLMLFRHASGEILLAILVTESPVVGASLPQLDLALKLAHEVAPKDPLRIIAPFFSGSAHSFVQAIEARGQTPEAKGAVVPVGLGQAEAPSERFCVLTGSATERSVDEAFGPIARNTVFGRTIPTDDQLLAQLVWPVAGAQQGDSQPLEQGRVAEISELGTGYGSGSGGAARKFRFPIHISDVRAERERSDNAAEAELFPTLRRTLGLRYNPLEERESDVPATLSSLTAYDDDLTLAQQMTGICTNHFRYLLVRASDPMDVVFLAKEARKYCPELVFLVLDYDELFVHPDLDSSRASFRTRSSPPIS